MISKTGADLSFGFTDKYGVQSGQLNWVSIDATTGDITITASAQEFSDYSASSTAWVQITATDITNASKTNNVATFKVEFDALVTTTC